METKRKIIIFGILYLLAIPLYSCNKDNVEKKLNFESSSKETEVESMDDDDDLTLGLEDAHNRGKETTVITESEDKSKEESDTTIGNGDNNTTSSSKEVEITSKTTSENNDSSLSLYTVSTSKFNIDTGVSVHDPSIVKANGKYYIFGSHLAQASTTSLFERWIGVGVQGYSNKTLYGGTLSSSLAEPYKWAGKKGDADCTVSDRVWAPDVIYNKYYIWPDGTKGAYMLYSCTTSTNIRSCIIYSVSKNVEGPYTYMDTILYSGFTKENAYDKNSTVNKNIANTNVSEVTGGKIRDSYFTNNGSYNNSSFPNAIDPNIFFDKDGQMWMTYGSWSGGIWIIKIDSSTGRPIHDYPSQSANGLTDNYFGKQIAAGKYQSCEAPYVLYDKNSGYYFMFVSYGGLDKKGGYNIRLFRSTSPDGEYTDAANNVANTGNLSSNINLGVKFMGGYMLPSLRNAYLSPGHNSAFVDDDGKMYVVYHTRFADTKDKMEEFHQPRVHQMFVNEKGWLCPAPFQTKGETISSSGYSKEDMAGTYYMIIHRVSNNTSAEQYFNINLNDNGTVTGAYSGKWSYSSGKYYMQIIINDVNYYGVFLKMNDEAGNNCITFSAVGSDNRTLWGVKYIN